jgi:hypothetical protein
MGFGAMEIVGKYPAHWRASTHPTALDQRINAFFTQALQMDSFTLELEASPDKA